MEHFVLLFLEWIGKYIAQRVTGGALKVAWQRVSPYLNIIVKSAKSTDEKIKRRAAASAQFERLTEDSEGLLAAAGEEIERLNARIHKLRERLAKYEPPDPE